MSDWQDIISTAPKVKPLEWTQWGPDWTAESILGKHSVAEYRYLDGPTTFGWWNGEAYVWHETLADAKAAAQADYERRILSALVAPPHSKEIEG